MARTGRPPLPTPIKLMLGGQYRKLNPDEPKVKGVARCPKNLPLEARKHWRRIAGTLEPLGLLSPADGDCFTLLCVALSRWHKAQEQINKLGEVVVFRQRPIQNPWCVVAHAAEATILKMAGEFGLTPSARTRLFASPLAPIPSSPMDHDAAERYFNDGIPDDPPIQ